MSFPVKFQPWRKSSEFFSTLENWTLFVIKPASQAASILFTCAFLSYKSSSRPVPRKVQSKLKVQTVKHALERFVMDGSIWLATAKKFWIVFAKMIQEENYSVLFMLGLNLERAYKVMSARNCWLKLTVVHVAFAFQR